MRVFLLTMSAIAFSGCASIVDFTPGAEEDFICKPVDGVGCVSTEIIDKNVVGGRRLAKAPAPSGAAPGAGTAPIIGDAVYRPQSGAQWSDTEIIVVRFNEFVDSDGNYHDPSTVRAVMNQGGWK